MRGLLAIAAHRGTETYYKPLGVKVTKPGRAGFCITGSSGGASQVSYALTHYGLDDVLDVVIPTGGPSHAALAKSMLEPSGERQGHGYPESTRTYIDKSFGYFDKDGPGRRQDAKFKARWDEESVATGGNDYQHPKTRVHFILGERDRGMQTVGRDYFERLNEERSPMIEWELARDTQHGITRTAAGRAALKAAILGIESPQPPAETTKPPSEGLMSDKRVDTSGEDGIDWDKARQIHRRHKAGEKLSAEEQSYLERAREARGAGRSGRNRKDRQRGIERPNASEGGSAEDPTHTSTRAGEVPDAPRVVRFEENPLGKYYLYFAHHKGSYIRLAYADELAGPWTIHEPGALKLEDVLAADDYHLVGGSHIASPDVHVDDENKQIRMYFHAQVAPHVRWGHKTGVAVSPDGLEFQLAVPRPIGEPYFRVFQREGWNYALGRTGNLARSRDGLTDWQEREDTFPLGKQRMGVFAEAAHEPRAKKWMRHTAVMQERDLLKVFFTRTGDAPESILLSTAELTGDWTTWKLSPSVTVLQPEAEYEGGNLPVEKSRPGSRLNRGPIRALQDPCIYQEGGRTFLLYSAAGENGIAIGELKPRK